MIFIEELELDRMVKRGRCLIDHSRCSWKCSLEQKDHDVFDMYVSRSFPILYHGDIVSLNSGVVFQIQVEDVSEPKGGIDSASDYQDAHIEFSLGFTGNSE